MDIDFELKESAAQIWAAFFLNYPYVSWKTFF